MFQTSFRVTSFIFFQTCDTEESPTHLAWEGLPGRSDHGFGSFATRPTDISAMVWKQEMRFSNGADRSRSNGFYYFFSFLLFA